MGYLDHTGLSYLWSKIRSALTAKQDKLSGSPGQVVGFDSSGRAAAQAAVTSFRGRTGAVTPQAGDYTAADVGAADRTLSNLSDPSAALHHLGAKAGENLLDNWYFVDPINQRGQDEYVEHGYTVDRWLLSSDDMSLQVYPGEFALFMAVMDNTYSALQQRIEDPQQYIGKQLTFSILIRSEGDIVLQISMKTQAGGNGFACHTLYDTAAGWKLITCTGTVPARTSAMYAEIAMIDPMGGNAVELYAAKLELGDHQTLAHKEGDTWVLNDPPPSKALELVKCQRHYQTGRAAYTKADGDRFVCTNGGLLTEMRTDPSIAISQIRDINNASAGTLVTIGEPTPRALPLLCINTSANCVMVDYTADADL